MKLGGTCAPAGPGRWWASGQAVLVAGGGGGVRVGGESMSVRAANIGRPARRPSCAAGPGPKGCCARNLLEERCSGLGCGCLTAPRTRTSGPSRTLRLCLRFYLHLLACTPLRAAQIRQHTLGAFVHTCFEWRTVAT
jgi:hypothetical protein